MCFVCKRSWCSGSSIAITLIDVANIIEPQCMSVAFVSVATRNPVCLFPAARSQGAHSPGPRTLSMGVYPIQNVDSRILDQQDVSLGVVFLLSANVRLWINGSVPNL